MKLLILAILLLITMAKAREENIDDFIDEEVPDLYKELGVARTSTTKEIKKAFRKLAVSFHPDKNKEEGAEEKFKRLNEANEVLANDDMRKLYDAELSKYEEWLDATWKPEEFLEETENSGKHSRHDVEQHPETLEMNRSKLLAMKHEEIESYFGDYMNLDDDSFFSLILEEMIEERLDKISNPTIHGEVGQNEVFIRELKEEYGSEFLQEWLEGVGHVSSRHLGEL